MHIHFSPQTIEALARVISGGSGEDRVGIYRSGPKLESFMRGCNVSMRIGSGSRVPTLVDALEQANRSDDQTVLRNIAELAADPRDFLDEPERQQAVIDFLNARLRYDGLELQTIGGKARLVPAGQSAAVIDALAVTVAVIDFDTVNHDLERAMANADSDPEDAVTAACSILESVCRSILVELGLPLPAQKDIQGCTRPCASPLASTPAREVFPTSPPTTSALSWAD